MMYELEYCGVTVFRRYFENTAKSKEKMFYKKLKKYVSKYIIPCFKKTFVDIVDTTKTADQYWYTTQMIQEDKDGERRIKIKEDIKQGHKIKIQEIKPSDNSKNDPFSNEGTSLIQLPSDSEEQVKKFDRWLFSYYLDKMGNKLVQDFESFSKRIDLE